MLEEALVVERHLRKLAWDSAKITLWNDKRRTKASNWEMIKDFGGFISVKIVEFGAHENGKKAPLLIEIKWS